MANKRVPCAGSCGNLIAVTRGSLPPGRAMCQPCRSTTTKTVGCAHCGEQFELGKRPGGRSRKSCSTACSTALRRSFVRAPGPHFWAPRPCADCAALTSRRGSIPLCSGCASGRLRARWRRKNVVRRGAVVEGLVLGIEQLGRRDGWRCHLCLQVVGAAIRSPHPRSPSFDHLVPISHGGTDAPENLRLAHLGCNSRRGNRGPAQLQLFG